MDSGTDTSVYSAKKTYNRLICKLDYTHMQVHLLQTHAFFQNPHMLISLLLLSL